MPRTRREFLISGAALGATPFSATLRAATLPQKPRVRQDIATLTADSPDVKALKDAVKLMRDPKQPVANLKWESQSEIHGSKNGDFKMCQHGNWFFAPWHRMYLYFFEKIVAKLSGNADFALPFWDWSRNPSIPDLFFQPPLADTTRTQKKGDTIDQSDYNAFVSLKVVNDLTDIADFGTFGGAARRAGPLEMTPHNFVHRWVGGNMTTAASPLDPIFWLHHCNVDRLYAVWIRKHPGRLPTLGWEDQEFKDFYDSDGTAGVGMKVKDTSDTLALGYTYARMTPVFTAGRAIELAPLDGPTAKGEVAGAVAVYTIAPKAKVASAIGAATAKELDPRNSTIRLELSGVTVPKNQDARVSVFINAPKPNADLPVTDPHHVASFTFFHARHTAGGKGHEHKDDGTISLSIDATHTLVRLFGDAAFGDNETLKIQVVAAPLFPGVEGAWKGTVKELAPSEVQLVVVGPKA